MENLIKMKARERESFDVRHYRLPKIKQFNFNETWCQCVL